VTTVVLSIVGMGTFAAVGILVGQAPPSGPQGVDPLGGSLSGIGFTELLVGVLGVLTVTGEYASGMIRVSLTAVPRRIPVLVGKAVVAAAAVLVVTVPAALLAFLGARTVLAREGISLSLAEPGVLRAILGAGLYSAVLAVFGVAFGTLLRNTAGAVASLFGLMYVLPVVGILLPDLGTRLMPYLPGNAGGAILKVRPSDMLAPWTGFALFVGYAVVATVIAALVMRRRDA
jgi:ABC-type transport system involved in multi-copper enzyme maturation permease subunit